MASTYHISKHSASSFGSLVDRGANGGLARADVHVLERTGRKVSVTGIDELPVLDIVTCVSFIQVRSTCSCMSMPIIVEVTPFTLYVKLSGFTTSVMINQIMWEVNKLLHFLMDMPLHYFL